tara:strand:+ start:3213 stop:3416 length:204 start_codon:yes stop_codon:yes gene_type:complete
MIKVKGYSGLYRDENTGAIVNCNDSEYRHRLVKIQAVDSQKKEIDRLKNELDEIKDLLKNLTNKNSV